ncbi:ADP-ribosylation factor GTPase-activating protein like [Quillaja saponaria]|uniref:ADP-ribosylation factor GTPase-activating protein like n=1 Tax=Quillaja saponaria TaxID=32244 RepID=A0AAD7LXK7_QUISA|nr:ADP-ribosylation factor GTPase-activating protein like [Quillaja saponaria]
MASPTCAEVHVDLHPPKKQVHDDQLQASYKELRSIREKQGKRLQYLETKAIHITIYYILFQSIIFLTITINSPSLSCQNWRIPFCLSLLVALIFGFTFFISIQEWARAKYHHEMNFVKMESVYGNICRIYHQQQPQMRSESSSVLVQLEERESNYKPDMVGVYCRKIYIYAMVSAMTAYTGLILYSCRSLLCLA